MLDARLVAQPLGLFPRLGAGLARAARRPLLDAAAAAARGARAKETRDSAAALAFRRDKRKERAAQALQKWRRDVAALRAQLGERDAAVQALRQEMDDMRTRVEQNKEDMKVNAELRARAEQRRTDADAALTAITAEKAELTAQVAALKAKEEAAARRRDALERALERWSGGPRVDTSRPRVSSPVASRLSGPAALAKREERDAVFRLFAVFPASRAHL